MRWLTTLCLMAALAMAAVATEQSTPDNSESTTARRPGSVHRGSAPNAEPHHSIDRSEAHSGRSMDDACEPQWVPTFGARPGVYGYLYAAAAHDDGTGPTLFVGGTIYSASGEPDIEGVLKWDGTRWISIGPVPLGEAGYDRPTAMAVFDDGTGPALYCGMIRISGVPNTPSFAAVMRWDGNEWAQIGEAFDGRVDVLTAFDDGAGPALYAGGRFVVIGETNAAMVAMWDGSSWTNLGSGITGASRPELLAMTVFDDGSGPALIVAGRFDMAGDNPASNIAGWDGSSWSPLSSGTDHRVRTMCVFDGGTGAQLYAGGNFESAGGVQSSGVARWNGVDWSAVGEPGVFQAPTYELFAFDIGDGEALYAVSYSYGLRFLRWSETEWEELGRPFGGGQDSVTTLISYVDPNTMDKLLIAAGGFRWINGAGNVHRGVSAWDGEEWRGFGDGPDYAVFALETFDDGRGDGPAIYVGGYIRSVGGVRVRGLGRWDGDSWESVAGSTSMNPVDMMAAHEDGNPVLYVGGEFDMADDVLVNNVAKWDGEQWHALGEGVHGFVRAFAMFDDGSGSALYVGGEFDTAGGMPAESIAKWDGSNWHQVGSGLSDCPAPGCNAAVYSLAVFDDGTGDALYAAGKFTKAGDTDVSFIARWDGEQWTPVGGGLSDYAFTLAVHDDGSGPALFAGGIFDLAGGKQVNRLAKWDGQNWHPLATGLFGGNVAIVCDMAVLDAGLGSGPDLYVGGAFAIPPIEDQVFHLGRWDGTQWHSLNNETTFDVRVLLAVEGCGVEPPALYAGGFFETSTAGDSYLAKWQGCADQLSADLTGDGQVDLEDFLTLLRNWHCVGCDCPGDANGDGVVNVHDLLEVIVNWGRVA